MPRIIFNGEEGDVFTNETGKVLYQFHASLENTCGTCLQYHLAVGPWWPIPIHRQCRCKQTLVAPGATAEPFVDFREILADLPPDQQAKAVGASKYKLLEAGVVEWEDVVTGQRVRTLREVVSREKLSVKRMVSAGVQEHIAEDAYASVNTPDHKLAAAHRKLLVERLETAGLSRSQINARVAAGLAERVTVRPIPASPPPIKPRPLGPLIDILGLDVAKVYAAIQPAGYAMLEEIRAIVGMPEAAAVEAIEALGRAADSLTPAQITAILAARDAILAATPKSDREKVAAKLDELGRKKAA